MDLGKHRLKTLISSANKLTIRTSNNKNEELDGRTIEKNKQLLIMKSIVEVK